MDKLVKRLRLKINVEIAVAMAISIYIAYMVDLKYAAAAGILTLATVQNTRKETILLTVKRLVGYLLMLVVAFLVFSQLGYNVVAYGVFVLIFAVVCSFLDMVQIITTNAVMATHFLDSQSMGWDIVANETWMFVIGVSVGVLVNIISPVFSLDFKKERKEMDDGLKEIFYLLHLKLRGIYEVQGTKEAKEVFDLYLEKKIKETKGFIKESEERLLEYANNVIFTDEKYLVNYFNMRNEQLDFLQKIFDSTKHLDIIRKESILISDFLEEVLAQYHETNMVEDLLYKGELFRNAFKESDLPKTRDEFETRARLYMIFEDIVSVLKVKRTFSENLTKEEMNKYWTRG